MDSALIIRLLLFAGCVLCSAFFAGSESALFSLGRVQLARMNELGHPRVGLIERLLAQPRRLIATIFIGNELVNIAAATLMTSMVAGVAKHLSETAVILIATVISVPVILLFGEITPKNIAQQASVTWASNAAWLLDVLARVFAPVRFVVEKIADATVHWLGGGRDHGSAHVGEREFRTLVELARSEGQIDPHERQLIHRVLELGERTVTQVMTPAAKMFAISITLPVARAIEELRGSIYSRVPVYEGGRDRIVGILHVKDLLGAARGLSGERRLRENLHRPFFVPSHARCDWVLREFRKLKTHLALVVDEYGHIIGLVTLEDLLEEVFGEIVDEKERPRGAAQ